MITTFREWRSISWSVRSFALEPIAHIVFITVWIMATIGDEAANCVPRPI